MNTDGADKGFQIQQSAFICGFLFPEIAIAQCNAMVKLEVKMPVNETNRKDAEAPRENVLDDNVTCEVCGKFGAYKLGDQFLCVDCYQESGSCCAGEFVKKDGE